MAGWLYKYKDRVECINLPEIQYAVGLKIEEGARKRMLSFGIRPGSSNTAAPTGEPIFKLQIKEPGQPPREQELGDWPEHTVALVTTDELYWYENGHWSLGAQRMDEPRARLLIEQRYPPKPIKVP
jgi:hypothetical protein